MLLRPPGRSAEPGPCAPPSPQLPVHTHLLSSVLPEATRSFLGISQSLLSHCDTPGPWHLSPHPPSFPELPRAPQTLAPSHSAVVTELPATWETRCPPHSAAGPTDATVLPTLSPRKHLEHLEPCTDAHLICLPPHSLGSAGCHGTGARAPLLCRGTQVRASTEPLNQRGPGLWNQTGAAYF